MKFINREESSISSTQREALFGHKSFVLWFTGYSGSGKSTLARNLEAFLFDLKIKTYVLDGDNIRHGICEDLGFSEADRKENIRRASEISKMFSDAGLVVIVSLISPYRADRDKARYLIGKKFIEIFCACPLSVCEDRDIKGLYKKARSGQLSKFTGVSDTYEPPMNPEIIVNTEAETINQSTEVIIKYLADHEFIL